MAAPTTVERSTPSVTPHDDRSSRRLMARAVRAVERWETPDQWRLWASDCPGSDDGRHRMTVVGYLRGHDYRGLECDRPLRVECRCCAAVSSIRCANHRESRCRSCAATYRRRLVRLAADGMDRRSSVGHQGMLTLTAPGDGPHRRLFWGHTWHPGMTRPDCDCHEHLSDGLGLWNASASGRWNHLRTLLAREYPGLVFLRAVEVQDGKRKAGAGRGALHLHVIVWTPQPLDLAVVAGLALRAGFGCGTQWAPAEPGSRRAAYYVAKYVTKACDSRAEVPWTTLDPTTGELVDHPGGRYRTWSSSRAWGLTMAEIRQAIATAARRDAARARGEDPDDDRDAAQLLADLLGAQLVPPDPG